ncbi:transcription repressor OFP13-like [Alnus glutinosa]|uniref:transcription repressor OFP13-like n=1 Tax=Alnus glutinosa TaxID=3517 RepID=UPI002D7877F0|nr:transcription repressor OFP13-like [Alnus glutinosa]
MKLPSIFRSRETKTSWKWLPLHGDDPMVKRLKLPSIFRSRKTKASWKWLPFQHLKSISSFRYKDSMMQLDSSCSQAAVVDESGGELIEMAVKALTSKRLSFEPGESSSLMGERGFSFQEYAVQAIESNDPYIDFRNSMEEMVEAYGLMAGKKDWDYLEELLAWYLRMNRKKNHGFIVEAFIDVFAGLPSCSSFCSFY